MKLDELRLKRMVKPGYVERPFLLPSCGVFLKPLSIEFLTNRSLEDGSHARGLQS